MPKSESFDPSMHPMRPRCGHELTAAEAYRLETCNREPAWASVDTHPAAPSNHFVVHEAHYATKDEDLAAALRQYGCHQRPNGTFIESYAADLAVWLQLTPFQRLAARLRDWSHPQALPPPQHNVPGSVFSTPHLDRYVHRSYPHKRRARDKNPQAAIEDDASVQEVWDEHQEQPHRDEDTTLWDAIETPRERASIRDDEGLFCTVCSRLLDECECICPDCKREWRLCICNKVSGSYLSVDDAPLHLTPRQRQKIAASMRSNVAETRAEHERRLKGHHKAPRSLRKRSGVDVETKRQPLQNYLPYSYEEALALAHGKLPPAKLAHRRRGRPRTHPSKKAYPGCVQLYAPTDLSHEARGFRLCFPWGIPQEWQPGWEIWTTEVDAKPEETAETYQVPGVVMEQAVRARERATTDRLVEGLPHDYPKRRFPKSHADAKRFVADYHSSGETRAPCHVAWIPPEELLPAETGLWLSTATVARLLGIAECSVSRWHQRRHIPTDKNGVRAHHYRLEDVIQYLNEVSGATDRYFPWHPALMRHRHPGAA